jgi:hypothetical protein
MEWLNYCKVNNWMNKGTLDEPYTVDEVMAKMINKICFCMTYANIKKGWIFELLFINRVYNNGNFDRKMIKDD